MGMGGWGGLPHYGKDGVLKRNVSAPPRSPPRLSGGGGSAPISGVLFSRLCEWRRRSAEQTGAAPTAAPL